MSKVILVANRSEFSEVTRGLCKDINYAQIHWRMWRDLCDAVEAHPLVWAEANGFWELTIDAHFKTTLANLSRAYDYQKDALSLNAWLLTIKAHHLEIFPDPVESGRQIDLVQLETDLKETTKDDPLVGVLVQVRDFYQAHTSVFRFQPLPNQSLDHSAFKLTIFDISELITRADSILRRYTLIFDNEVFPGWLVGQDSYKTIFKTMQESIIKAKTEREAFQAKLAE